MGVDTHGRLKGHILPEDILNFIKQKIDCKAKISIDTTFVKRLTECNNIKKVYDDSEYWTTNHGFIYFTSKEGNYRSLFYSYDNVNFYENLDYFSKLGLRDLVVSETTSLSLGYNEEAVEIMTEIVAEFGGWIDKDDCDDEPYEPVIKNADGTIKPVYHVSINDVYDKFGGVVIIDK
jgi:hypothetical protein